MDDRTRLSVSIAWRRAQFELIAPVNSTDSMIFSRSRSIFFIGAACDDPWRIVRQRPLQCLRIIPGRTHPDIAFLSSVVRITGIAFGWFGSTVARRRRKSRISVPDPKTRAAQAFVVNDKKVPKISPAINFAMRPDTTLCFPLILPQSGIAKGVFG
jgi:hypothetical protein